MRDALRAAAASLATAAVVGFAYGLTSAAAWRAPAAYHGDAWPTLGLLKAAAEGHLAPLRPVVVPELGAPYAGDWNGYLRQHKVQYWLAGRLVRAIGLFPAANVLLPLADAGRPTGAAPGRARGELGVRPAEARAALAALRRRRCDRGGGRPAQHLLRWAPVRPDVAVPPHADPPPEAAAPDADPIESPPAGDAGA